MKRWKSAIERERVVVKMVKTKRFQRAVALFEGRVKNLLTTHLTILFLPNRRGRLSFSGCHAVTRETSKDETVGEGRRSDGEKTSRRIEEGRDSG